MNFYLAKDHNLKFRLKCLHCFLNNLFQTLYSYLGDKKIMKLVCIPAYNEKLNITEIVKSSQKFADMVVVCDDGSTDNTAELAKEAGAVVIQHKKNQGYGSSIASLFDYSRTENADIMVTIDGDGQHSPDQIPALFNAITDHNVDVAIGSRSLNDSNSPNYRKAGIKIITSATNYTTNIKVSDSQSGFRAYSKNAIHEIHPTESGMAVSTEILLKISNKGFSIAEVPITISYDGNTSSQHPVSHGTSVLANTIKYVSIRHPIIFYGIPGIVLFLSGIFLGATFLDGYLNPEAPKIFYGQLLGSIVTILLGSLLIITSILLFSMANLIRDKN